MAQKGNFTPRDKPTLARAGCRQRRRSPPALAELHTASGSAPLSTHRVRATAGEAIGDCRSARAGAPLPAYALRRNTDPAASTCSISSAGSAGA